MSRSTCRGRRQSAGHSLSPAIHNPLFEGTESPPPTTIASVERFDEVEEPFSAGRIRGLSAHLSIQG